MFRKLLITLLVIAGNSLAHAGPMIFDVVGVGDANNSASVTFAYDGSTATVILDIENTSGLFDPRVTAFAFNAPADVTGISSFVGPSGWSGVFDANDIDTPGQFGFYDMAGITGPNFNGGSPNDGIPLGSTFHFEIVLAGSGLAALTEMSFLSQYADDPAGPPDHNEQYFITRFQRTGSRGQDSDVAIPNGDPNPPVQTPEPASVLLLLAGVSAMAASRKRQKRS